MRFRNATLPVMMVLAVISAAVGLQLGQTTIANIDPLYFEGAAPEARDVTKNPPPQRANAYAQASSFGDGYAARSQDCGSNCPAMLVEQTSGGVPNEPLYTYSDPTIEPRWEKASVEMPLEALPEPSASSRNVRRYTDYPVSAEQAERPAADKPKPTNGPLEPDGL